jgi:8-oxo-dGTP diphosphatase
MNDSSSLDTFQLPDTFWRVSAKALVYDTEDRLLVFMDKNNEWEVPGGGWEHDETLEECIRRELLEEVKVGVTDVSNVQFCYKGKAIKGQPKICVAVKATLDDSALIPSDDDLVEARYVTREEFLQLPFQPGEETIKQCVNEIWALRF